MSELVSTLRKLAEQDHLKIKEGFYAEKIMKGVLTLQDYKILILANRIFHGKVQSLISPFFNDYPEYQLKKRNKIPALAQDLAQLNITEVFNDYQFEESLKIDSFWQALGAAYVVEGTAIGGAIIRKKLLANKNITKSVSINFYGCYQKELSPLWKSFLSFLEEKSKTASKEQIDETVNKAKEIFLFYEHSIRKSQECFSRLSALV